MKKCWKEHKSFFLGDRKITYVEEDCNGKFVNIDGEAVWVADSR